MHNPPHPGETRLQDILPALGVSTIELARRLGFARETLSRIMQGHAAVGPDLAVRLERAGIGKARTWLGVQAEYDVRQAEHWPQPKIERFSKTA